MKSKLIAVALLFVTAGAVVFYPFIDSSATVQPVKPPIPQGQKIEVVFVLDTTSSMSGLIETAKEKIWSIATTLAQAEQIPEIHMGLVAFRDRGDEYVTDVIDLSTDLDTMYGRLMQFAAVGGGDGPESVNRALNDAVHRISWSQDPSSYQVIFLVGDAPPHMDYQGEAQYPEIVRAATAKGIVVNAIQCGESSVTVAPWQEIARLGNGRGPEVEVVVRWQDDERLARETELVERPGDREVGLVARVDPDVLEVLAAWRRVQPAQPPKVEVAGHRHSHEVGHHAAAGQQPE